MTEIFNRKGAASALSTALSGSRTAARRGRLAGLVGTVVVGLAAAALCAPFLHTLFWLADEGVLLNGAVRILHGSRLYVDFFEFLPPGGFIVTAAWFRIAGISLLSARLLTLLIITGVACFTYLACLKACRQAFYPALIVIAWLVMTQGFWTQLSHHWLTTLFSMIVVWSALSNLDQPIPRLSEPLIAGLAAGWAAMTVETSGALVMLAGAAAFAGSRRPKAQLTAFVAASAVAPAALLGYLVAEHTVRAAFADVVVFAATHYASIQWVPFGYWPNIQNFPLIFIFPVAALVVLLCVVRSWPGCLRDHRFGVCIAFALAGFIGCYPRSDASHIGFTAPLAFPLLTYCLKDLTADRLRKFRVAALIGGLIVFCFPTGFAYGVMSRMALHAPTAPTARGSAAFLGGAVGVGALAARIAQTPAGQSYFFYPFIPVMSFLTAREQVSRYDIFTPDYTTPAQYRETCLAVMRQASWIVIDRSWQDPRHWKQVFPAMRDPAPRETRMFEHALTSGFSPVARYGEFELRRRTPAANPAACAGITR